MTGSLTRFSVCLTLLVALIASGCTPGMKRWMAGEQSKRDVYLNLMTPEQAETLRQMEKDEVDEQKRILYVQEIGVYDYWAAATPEVRQHILKKRVVEGMKPVEVQMAWGRADAEEELTTDTERQDGHQKLLWQYQPRQHETGVTYDRSVVFFDNRVVEIRD